MKNRSFCSPVEQLLVIDSRVLCVLLLIVLCTLAAPRRAQAGDARADNMNHAAVHRMPYRRRAPSRRRRLALARRRGGAKPSFSILSRIEP